jgi:rhodanese-related sulfurtransferase
MTEPTQIARGEVTLSEDFNKHRITGFVPHAQARGLDPTLDVPLISKVTDNLWQGGCPDYESVELPEGFDYVLSLYPWGAQYILPDGCERDVVKMYDSLDQDTSQVDELAEGLAQRIREGQTVLVHCQAGLNRSGMLAAHTLKKLGYTGEEALKLLRDSRSQIVCCNEAFEKFILEG